jgi:hypothetical protein
MFLLGGMGALARSELRKGRWGRVELRLDCSWAAASRASAVTVADLSVGSTGAALSAGVRPSSRGVSATVWAKFSGVLVASSEAKRRWRAVKDCCCWRARVAGETVERERGVAMKALEGAALSARAAERRRRNLGRAG